MGNIRDINNQIPTVPDDAIVYAGNPVATPELYEDANPTKAVFLKEDRARITVNETNISLLAEYTADIANLNTKALITGITTNYEWVGPGDCRVTYVGVLQVSGSPRVKVGTTDGGDEVLYEGDVNVEYGVSCSIYQVLGESFFLKMLNGGEVKMVVLYNNFLYTEI